VTTIKVLALLHSRANKRPIGFAALHRGMKNDADLLCFKKLKTGSIFHLGMHPSNFLTY
jgi:hypothetical protein